MTTAILDIRAELRLERERLAEATGRGVVVWLTRAAEWAHRHLDPRDPDVAATCRVHLDNRLLRWRAAAAQQAPVAARTTAPVQLSLFDGDPT